VELARFLLESNNDERGIFIRAAAPPPVGLDLNVQMSLPDGRELTLQARVVYRSGDEGTEPGMGVQLTHMSAEQAERLQELMTNPDVVRGLHEAEPKPARPRAGDEERQAVAALNRPDPRTPGARRAPRPAIVRDERPEHPKPRAPEPPPPPAESGPEDARLASVLMHMDRSRFDAAERQVMDLLADEPSDVSAQKLLLVIQARRLRSQFDFERAIHKYGAILKLDPEHAEAKAQLSALGDELAHSQALFNRVFGRGDK
jgi:hypothetical protein